MQIAVELSAKQAENLLEQLPMRLKIHLVRRWEKETWPDRFRRLIARIDQSVGKKPDLVRQALKTVDPARRALHARRNRH